MSKKFIKNKEDFVCEKCGAVVMGTGYTNHCPQCLWSKHVDINPGDRAAGCGGMMRPVGVRLEKGEFVLTHECEKCGHSKNNKASLEDSLSAVL
jgi:rubrerythrin